MYIQIKCIKHCKQSVRELMQISPLCSVRTILEGHTHTHTIVIRVCEFLSQHWGAATRRWLCLCSRWGVSITRGAATSAPMVPVLLQLRLRLLMLRQLLLSITLQGWGSCASRYQSKPAISSACKCFNACCKVMLLFLHSHVPVYEFRQHQFLLQKAHGFLSAKH